MNMEELRRKLAGLGVSPSAYCLSGGLPSERYCLNPGDTWEVYYSERGQKNDLRRFAKEETACTYMLFKLCGLVGK